MQITRMSAQIIHMNLKEPLVVAFGTLTAIPMMLVRVETDTGLTGYGEVNPLALVTGESIDTEQAAFPLVEAALRGANPLAIAHAHEIMTATLVGHTALKAGIDLALYDILGKQAGAPLYQLLGGTSDQVETDITLTIAPVKAMMAEAKARVAEGFNILKVKVGVDLAHDDEAIAAILAAVGPTVQLRLDANQGWTPKTTISFMRRHAAPNLTLIEQPLPAADHADNALVRQGIDVPLVLDEAVHSPADALAAIRHDETDAINIKLMKCEGLFGAQQIAAITQAAQMSCMIGCMAESRLGIAAAVHFAAATKNVVYIDLDSHLLLADTPQFAGGFTQAGPLMTLTDAPGLGVTVDE